MTTGLWIASTWVAAAACAQPLTIDPRVALDDLRARFRREPVAEYIDVRVVSDSESRAETLIFQSAPPSTVQVTFGTMTLWTDGAILRIVDARDQRAYFEEAIDGAPLAAVERVLPPFPIPHVALALGEPSDPLTAYLPGVRWSDATIDASRSPAIFRLSGSSAHAETDLTADVPSARLLTQTTLLDDGQVRIEVSARTLDPSETPPLGPDFLGRTAVRDLLLLRERLPQIRPGMTLPDLGLLEWRDGNEWPVPIGKPSALVMMRRWSPGFTAHAAIRAAQRVTMDVSGFKVHAAIVFEPDTPQQRVYIDAFEEEIAPLSPLHGSHPIESIERFDEDADQVLVVIDGSGVVRASIALTPPAAPGAVIDSEEVGRFEAAIRDALRGPAAP